MKERTYLNVNTVPCRASHTHSELFFMFRLKLKTFSPQSLFSQEVLWNLCMQIKKCTRIDAPVQKKRSNMIRLKVL